MRTPAPEPPPAELSKVVLVGGRAGPDIVRVRIHWLLLLAVCAGCATNPTRRTGFDASPAAAPPAGWTCTFTGQGEPRWEVVADPTAPSPPRVLRQSGVASFPLALCDAARVRDGFVQVKFKAVSGAQDQAGGVVWRARDRDNYYVCRANALEDNVVLYKTENGQRKALDIVGRAGGYGVKTKVVAGQWHTLRVEFAGSRFQVSLNGTALFEVEDATFPAPGRLGLWTKADSVTLFDDFEWGGR